jgi:hypothetical protein
MQMSKPSTPPSLAPAVGLGKARIALLAVGALSLVIFVAVVTAAYRRSPSVDGLLTGVFTGLFAALLFAAAGGWALVQLISPKPKPLSDLGEAAELEQVLGPSLAELEAVRLETLHQVNARLTTRLPLSIAVGVGVWIVSQGGTHPWGLFGLLEMSALGGLGGYYWASHQLGERYRRLYKERVLPQLAAQFGALSYRPAETPDMGALREQHIFREFDRVIAEDEIFGVYRGMALNIVELRLTFGSGKERRVEFDGLLITVELPRHLNGVTAVVADNGTLGNLKDRFECEGRKRVGLEDPAFEKAYEVYGTDQVDARALLTPSFMERFLSLGQRAAFLQPLALAQDNKLTIALPKSGGGDLFEPPSYRQPAKSRVALLALYSDIQAVLRAADAVIDLDHTSPGMTAAPQFRGRP